MSKIGNYRVGLQETDDYRIGWEAADRGEPRPQPFVTTVREFAERREAQQLGWDDYHLENGQFGAGA